MEQDYFPKIRDAGTFKLTDLPRTKLEIGEAEVTAATKLSDLVKEYAVFSLGLYYLHVRYERDPIHQFFEERDEDSSIYALECPKPVFRGMNTDFGNTYWNNILHVAPRAVWADLNGFLGSLAIVDRKADLMVRLRQRRVWIVDPFFDPVAGAEIPLIATTVFSLDTNKGCVFVVGNEDESTAGDPAAIDAAIKDPMLDVRTTTRPDILWNKPAVIKTRAVVKETDTFYRAIAADSTKPYDGVDQ